MNYDVEVLISKEEIEKRVDEIANEIMVEFQEEPITMVCVLKGGVMFMVDLARKIKQNVEIDFLDVKSYGNSMISSGKIEVMKDLSDTIEGKNIIIVEDIIDSGRTLKYVLEMLKKRNPKKIKVCTLLDKPEQRVVDVSIDYVGFIIPNEFVVGYGLDYAQNYRNLNYIGCLKI